ncbi:hypothetical protein D3C81_1581440 [compost metagenome]
MAVGELALVGAKLAQLAARAIQRHQAVQHILELDAVGADVLHRRRADRAGNQAEVLQPGQPLLQGPLHERMPGLAGFGLHQHLAALLLQQAAATADHAQHQGIEIAGQQQVAAAAHHQQRSAECGGGGQRFAHLGIRGRLGVPVRLHRHAEGVEGLQRLLLMHAQAHRPSRSCSISRSQASSIMSSTRSKPSAPP